MSTQTVLGQPSWRIVTPQVEAFVTVAGGHLGPVRFRLGNRTVEPFSVAPWAEEPIGQPDVQMLRSLRGDFFCMPFGGNETPYLPSSFSRGSGAADSETSHREENEEEGPPRDEAKLRPRRMGVGTKVECEGHPQHGDTANLDWTLESLNDGEIALALETQTRPGRVEKRIRIEGTTIYQTHTISEMCGPMCFGHHAMLRFPSPGHVSTSPFLHGRVFPDAFERPEAGGYTSLLPGAKFESLSEVPMANGGRADLTRYPAREGFEDLVQLYHPSEAPFAWNAVVVDGYLWLALKNPRTLPATVLWLSNGGRHYNPWNGRHRRVLGVEDVCAYFHYGLAESVAPNDAPVPTFVELRPDQSTEIRYAMAIVAAPDNFGAVTKVEPSEKSVTVRDERGNSIPVQVDLTWVIGT
jgi:hypothetical protein